MSDYDSAPTDPHHGGKLTPDMMARRIAELEGDLSVARLALAARVCSECPARDRVAELSNRICELQGALRDLVLLERTHTLDISGKRRTYAMMQNGKVLADRLDAARELLGKTA
jgi:hypothetical protein